VFALDDDDDDDDDDDNNVLDARNISVYLVSLSSHSLKILFKK
jgi:hypothetical protein